MLKFSIITEISAPPAACFDLARDVEFHAESLAESRERVVDRPGHRLLVLGDEVEFEGRHFGLWWRHRSRIEAFTPPSHFRDEMVRGAFRSFVHDHHFDAADGGTRMSDVVRFEAPLGPLGVLVGRLVLLPHLRRLIESRAAAIRTAAEDRS